MKIKSPIVSVVAALSIAGAVFAFQDAPAHAPDSKKATTSIVVNDATGDEISMTYRTVKYSQAQIDGMKDSAETRKMWAQFMPQKLSAELTLDVDLTYTTAVKEHKLPKGKYQLSMGMNDELGWDMFLLANGQRRGKVHLDIKESAIEFSHLTFNFMTSGENGFKLAIGYGKMGAVVPFSVAAAAQ
jgi:hypothetical protein